METTAEKRKVHRSPSYPVFDLKEAIQKAEAVYNSEKRSATTLEVIASHMGYSQPTGPGGRAVSALRQFGLIEESGGKYRVSDLGYILIHFDRVSPEWKGAVRQAATRPVLFRELAEEFPNGLPSDATLRNDLLKKGFNPAAISDVVSIIRNTISLVGEAQEMYAGTDMHVVEESAPPAAGRQRLANPLPIPLEENTRRDIFSLTEGQVVLQWPGSLSKESFEDLGAWLDLVKRKIGRSVKVDAGEADGH